MTTIYFDTCALNRLTDESSQARVRAETEAVIQLLDRVTEGKLQWLASTVLKYEIEQNPDRLRRLRALSLLPRDAELIAPTPSTISRASQLRSLSLGELDALHLALAEQGDVDWLITTDDRFVSRARLHSVHRGISVINPVDLLQRRFPWLLPNP